MNSNPDMGDARRVVAQGYDRVAHDYARLESGANWPRLEWLRKALDRLEPGSAVLDLGCGSGDPADIEIAREHQVTGVDISAVQIELARQNVPAGRFIHADAAAVAFPPASFDAVVSFYSLEHIPRQEHAALLRRIHQWLRAGGYLLLSTEAGEVAATVGEWLGVPMFFSSYDPETVQRLVAEAGFAVVETAVQTQMEGETEIPYLWLLARKQPA